jgi:hypothetical protein
MSLVTCPLCGCRTTPGARCPECSADLTLDRDAAFDELLSRGGPPSMPISARPRRAWLRRRPLTALICFAVVALVVFSCPLWAGYFGPRAAVYAKYWRPWRTQFEVTVSKADWPRNISLSQGGSWPKEVVYSVSYHDPWDMFASSSGEMSFWTWVDRFGPRRPWRVTGGFTGG